jgi:hypothetical protein
MSYVYPTGLHAGYTNFSDYMALRMSGITGTPSGVPRPTGTDGFLLAMCDAILAGAMGPTGPVISEVGSGQVSPTGNDYTGIAQGSLSVPFARPYLFNVDLSNVFSSATNGTAYFRLAIDGVPGPSLIHQFTRNFANVRGGISFCQRIFVAAGTRTIAVEWKATTQFSFDTGAGIVVNVT